MGQSPYKTMWLIAMFDLPVDSEEGKKAYITFRKVLIKSGFMMLQYSVYGRHCESEEAAKVYRRRLKQHLPERGQVRVITLTDVQFGKMEVYQGKKRGKTEESPQQLILF